MAGMMPGYDPTALGFNLQSAQAVLMKSASDAFVNTVINGGSYSDNIANALAGQATNVGMAVGFKAVGGWALGKYEDGSIQKVLAHALMGGLVAEATGSDFKTGAMAAGANEALINVISNMVGGDKNLEVMASQLTGIVAAAAVNGDVAKGAEIAKYATTYNRQLHFEEQKWLNENVKEFAQKENITEQVAMERLSQQALKNTDMLWRSVLSDGNDSAAQNFLAGAGKTFVNNLGTDQKLFTAENNQLFRPEMFADSADPAFYKQFVQSGVSRDLSTGLMKELKDSGVALKDGVVDLAKAAKENPTAVFKSILEGVAGMPAGVVDSFKESGQAIGEGAAVALNYELSGKLNAIYGQDVGTAQQTLLAIRIFAAVTGAKGVASAGDAMVDKAIGKKLDEVLDRLELRDDIVAKDAASGLVSGETGLAGTGKAAANDESSVGPKGSGQVIPDAIPPPSSARLKTCLGRHLKVSRCRTFPIGRPVRLQMMGCWASNWPCKPLTRKPASISNLCKTVATTAAMAARWRSMAIRLPWW
ncbi:hypothetical protein PSA5_13375 [Pseudomonas syringae pv. actinidiae]|nr:hypothetical protein PSA5_13375 [Pseudomonas syringae pv. actinidiae]